MQCNTTVVGPYEMWLLYPQEEGHGMVDGFVNVECSACVAAGSTACLSVQRICACG